MSTPKTKNGPGKITVKPSHPYWICCVNTPKLFHPHRYVSLWSYGLLDGSFPQRSLRPSQRGRQVPHVATRNTMVASSFLDMHLSIACAATDADYQNRIILRDNTLNFPVVAQQPHPDPNYAPHTAARRVAAA